MHSSYLRLALAVAAAAGLLALAYAGTSADAAPRPPLVISEAYGGGGNSGATLTNDFIELQNLGTSAADLRTGRCSTSPPPPGATTTWRSPR